MQKRCIVGQFCDKFLMQLHCTTGKWMSLVSWHLVYVGQDYLRRVYNNFVDTQVIHN